MCQREKEREIESREGDTEHNGDEREWRSAETQREEAHGSAADTCVPREEELVSGRVETKV